MMMKPKTIQYMMAQRKAKLLDPQLCAYNGRACMKMRIEGYDYCSRHIVEDKNSPFKQCFFMSAKTNRRCRKLAAKTEKKEGYCLDHGRKAALLRPRSVRRHGARATPETLLEDLEHHHTGTDALPSTSQPTSSSRLNHANLSLSGAGDVITTLTPTRSGGGATSTGRLLSDQLGGANSRHPGLHDFLSEEESGDEWKPVDRTWRGDVDSDNESIDSEQDDPLKYAGVYTSEEVALITREKLIRLQSLYIDQFKRLQHVLHERRRRYLINLKPEREYSCISAAKNDPAQKHDYNKLMAMRRYHKPHGVEAIMHRRVKERRLQQSESSSSGTACRDKSVVRCLYSERDERCPAHVLPFSKYCQEHILSDPGQVLYEACQYGTCGKSVPRIYPRCPLHRSLHPASVDRLPHRDQLLPQQSSTEMTSQGKLGEMTSQGSPPISAQSIISVDEEGNMPPLRDDEEPDSMEYDESLLLSVDGAPTLEEAVHDVGLEPVADELVLMLS